MSRPRESSITIELPNMQRRNTFPMPPERLFDPEAQRSPRSTRPPGVRRTSTVSTTIAEETTTPDGRRDTVVSDGSGLSSPTLQRIETWRVEEEAVHGYPKLATFLGGTDGFAIYKRFAALNARNLLYHQAKLTRLEHELNEMEQGLAHEQELHYTVDHIFHSESGTAGYKLQKKYENVSNALERYNRLLLEQRRLHELPAPDDSIVEVIHNYIKSDKAPKPDWLQHPENTVYAVWDDDRTPVQKDLVTLNPEFKVRDPFTKFFTSFVISWWHALYSRFKKPDGDLDEYIYTGDAMGKYMSAIVMVVASALPTCAIVALYFIHSPLWRLIFIVLFSGVFAAALTFFTDAKRVEVFMASVTLAGVQVVFIGTAFGNGASGNCSC